MRILLTGAKGFIGKNLSVRLSEVSGTEVLPFIRGDSLEKLKVDVAAADAIIHMAGENRPQNLADFVRVNVDLTENLCQAIRSTGRRIPLLLASSTQAALDNPYGKSKRAAEFAVERLVEDTGNPSIIYRLPGVFGKWSKPNYNSVVATFCHHIANGIPIQIRDPAANVRLVYVDNVVSEFLSVLHTIPDGLTRGKVTPEYEITLGDLADQIKAFRHCRDNLLVERVGSGLVRALYSTYVSYLPTAEFVYDVPKYADARGVFVEMLKTLDSGQFSYFTSLPGTTRGNHYHHSKTEKFLVIKGTARFGFRHVLTGETHEIITSGDKPQIVETVPGWSHNISNIGNDEMVVMLWANEIFDREHPDTISGKV